MSDRSKGEGWWLASDGRWYPPEALPQQASPSQPARSWTWKKVLLALVGVIVIVAVSGALGGSG